MTYEFYERKEQIKKTLLVVSKAKVTAANALRRSSKYDTEEPKSLQSAECGDNFATPLRYGMVTLLELQMHFLGGSQHWDSVLDTGAANMVDTFETIETFGTVANSVDNHFKSI